MKSCLLAAVLVALPCFACEAEVEEAPSQAPAAAAASDEVIIETAFTCFADTSRITKSEDQRFASLKVVLSGTKATIHSLVLTPSYAAQLEHQAKEGTFLARADTSIAFNTAPKPYLQGARHAATSQDPIELLDEAHGARLVLPAAMVTGPEGKLDIAWDALGALWDHYGCKR